MAFSKGALPAASLGPPPMCMPTLFTATSGNVLVPAGGGGEVSVDGVPELGVVDAAGSAEGAPFAATLLDVLDVPDVLGRALPSPLALGLLGGGMLD